MMISKFGYCSSPVKVELLRTYRTSYYGCVLWSLNSTHIQRLYITSRKIIRNIWNVRYHTHCKLLPILMSYHDIQTQLSLRFSKFTFTVFCYKCSDRTMGIIYYTPGISIGRGLYIVHETDRRPWSGVAQQPRGSLWETAAFIGGGLLR